MSDRALHGVNLAGWLTLEPWVTPEPFASTGALDEPTLAASLGEERYQRLVREHRRAFMEEADFTKIAARGFNAVRLPVPWYAFDGVGPEHGPYVSCVDEVDQAFEWAEEIGLRVVVTLAASPGRRSVAQDLAVARGDTPGSADAPSDHRAGLLEVISALSGRYARRAGFYGMEVLDAPIVRRRVPPVRALGPSEGTGTPRHVLRNYYRDAYAAVREAVGDDVVVILPDGGMPDGWRVFMAQRRYKNVWISCQLFHNADHVSASGPLGVRRLAEGSRATLARVRRSGLPVAVSAWSGALPYADSLMTPEGRIALERVFISEQLAAFSDCPAWFFHTWKTSGRLSGWDARVSLATFERRMLG